MKFLTLKSPLVAGLFLLAASQSGVVSAHSQSGSFTTGQRGAIDWYQVTCSDDGSGAPDHLLAEIKDNTASTAKVGVVVKKGTSCTEPCAKNAQDVTDTDANFSPSIKVKQGSGVYDVYVHHTSAGSDSYSLTYHCETSGNVHTGTSITSKQQM